MRYLFVVFALLLTFPVTAQPRINVDSVALYRVEEDQYTRGRELLRAKGFISQFKAYEDGRVEVGIFRQHVGYLSTEKGTSIKTGPNALPALWRLSYQDGRLQPQTEQFASITSSLIKPFTYRLQTILGQTGGVQTETVNLTDNTTATDYSRLLKEQATALGYRGDIFTQSGMVVQNNALVVQQSRYQYVPFANRYLPLGLPTGRTYPLTSRQPPSHTLFTDQGTMTYHQPEAGQLITLDTLGHTLQTLALDGLAGKRLWAIAEATGENPAPVVSAGTAAQHVGTDWLFGPAGNKAKTPDMVLIRTDAQGKLVFRHAFTVSYEDYGLAQADMVSNATDALVNITLGKGLAKYVIAYAKINAGGVVFQRVWDKQDPAQVVRVNGGGSAFKAFTDGQQLISLPKGESLLISYDADHSPMKGTTTLIGYGALHLSDQGEFIRYYSLRANVPPMLGATLPPIRVLSQPDGRVMLWVNEARNAQVEQFRAFSLLDTELQDGSLPVGTKIANSQPSVLVNVTTNGLRSANSPPPQSGGMLGGLGRLADRAAAASSPFGLDNRATGSKRQEQIESSPFNQAPALYWIDTQAGTVLFRDFGRLGGYSLPNQPFVVVNRSRNEAYIPLRTPLQPTEWPRSARYPQAVYFKLARMSW